MLSRLVWGGRAEDPEVHRLNAATWWVNHKGYETLLSAIRLLPNVLCINHSPVAVPYSVADSRVTLVIDISASPILNSRPTGDTHHSTALDVANTGTFHPFPPPLLPIASFIFPFTISGFPFWAFLVH